MKTLRVSFFLPEQYIKPDESVPISGRREEACFWFASTGSSRYAERKTPNALGKPHTRVSIKNAPANWIEI